MPALPEGSLKRLAVFYETLTPEGVGRIRDVYAEEATFRDPFNDVRGVDEIRRVLLHMFESLASARFAVREAGAYGDQAFLVWDFHFRLRRWQPKTWRLIHGASHVRFDSAGKVIHHRDYWDAAGEIYEKLPLIGAAFRALRRKPG